MRRSHRARTFEIHPVPLLAFLLMITALFGTLPQSASAEDNQKRARTVATPDPEGPTTHGYSLEEMDLRVKRARIGLITSGAITLVGGLLIGLPFALVTRADDVGGIYAAGFVVVAGIVITVGGIAGMIATGILLRKRKQKRRGLEETFSKRPRRVQWDLARSRVVF